jgi:starch synthase
MSMNGPSVWHVTREYAGFAEAGGVKDAVHGLAAALTRAGAQTSVMLPLYGFLREKISADPPIADFSLPIPDHDKANRIFNERVRIYSVRDEGVRLLLVDSPRFAEKRDVYTYTSLDETENPYKLRGTGHWDSHEMNMILQKAALEAAIALGERPSIFHCHDGHAALLPALMREYPAYSKRFGGSGAVVTIHNAGMGYHQEIWNVEFARLLTGLKEKVISKGLLGGTIDPLLLASHYALLSTVSEKYAKELLSEEDGELSAGLGPALRERGVALTGITNGVETQYFDPRDAARSGLPFSFDPATGDWEGKRKCRKTLYGSLGGSLPADGPALFGFIGRLTHQKGIDVLIEAVGDLLQEPGCPCFLVLGQGDKDLERRLLDAAASRVGRGRLVFIPKYDPALAKLVYASCDFLLVPSVYEPCGLTDFHAQLMGTIPLVHHVGGLVKVRDGETGFSYVEQSPFGLARAVQRCDMMFHEEPALLERIRRTAFREIFETHTWDSVVGKGYIPLYGSASRGGPGENPWKGR